MVSADVAAIVAAAQAAPLFDGARVSQVCGTCHM
jgi:hypothetical protein